MAHSKSAEKRIRQNRKRNAANRTMLSSVRSQLKKTLKAIEAGDAAKAREELRIASQRLDKAARHRTIHPNEASRRKSRLAKRIAQIGKK